MSQGNTMPSIAQLLAPDPDLDRTLDLPVVSHSANGSAQPIHPAIKIISEADLVSHEGPHDPQKRVSCYPAELAHLVDITDYIKAEACGRGAFGEVRILTHKIRGRMAAKRVRSPDAVADLRRTLRESSVWASIEHENVVPFGGIILYEGVVYLLSAFAENGTIMKYLGRNPSANRLKLLSDAAAGLAHIHSLGFVHGDVKADNIVVSSEGTAMWCDFGLSRQISSETSDGLRGAKSIRYASPELCETEHKTTGSDIWAFGMTMYQVIVGSVPYNFHATHRAIIVAICIKDERPPRYIDESTGQGVTSDPLWELISSCWHRDPKRRPHVIDALELLNGPQIAISTTAATAEPLARVATPVDQSSAELTKQFAFRRLDGVIGRADLDFGRVVGRGGSSKVVLIEHHELGRVAVKRSYTETSKGFGRGLALHEAEIWATVIGHPNVLPLIGVVLDVDDDILLVSPFMKNGDMSTYLRSHPTANRVALLAEAACGIAFLHHKRVLHGDIKPENILISDQLRPVIFDFNVSRLRDEITASGLRGRGTARYMSSEFFVELGSRSFASDAWSFGMTIYSALSGDLPLWSRGYSTIGFMRAIQSGERPAKEPTQSRHGVSYEKVWESLFEPPAPWRPSSSEPGPVHATLRPETSEFTAEPDRSARPFAQWARNTGRRVWRKLPWRRGD